MFEQNISMPNQQPEQIPVDQKPKNFLFKKLNPKITYPLIIIFGLIAIGISRYILYQEIYRDKSTQEITAKKTTLTIESDPGGITIPCNMTEEEATPYDCELPDGATETIITAPSGAERDGKIYVFQSWDGCSESNEDWRVCKVVFNNKESKKIKANYAVDENITSLDDLNISENITEQDNITEQEDTILSNQCSKTLVINNDNTATCSIDLWPGVALEPSYSEIYINRDYLKKYGSFNPPLLVTCNSNCTGIFYRWMTTVYQERKFTIYANTATYVNPSDPLHQLSILPHSKPTKITLKFNTKIDHITPWGEHVLFRFSAPNSDWYYKGFTNSDGFTTTSTYPLTLKYNEVCRYQSPATSCE